MINLEHFEALLRLERNEQKLRIETLHKELSIQERAARGITLLDLESVDESYGLGGRILVTLERFDKSEIEGKVGIGDLVIIKPRKAETPESATGVISRKTRNKLTVAFDKPPPRFVFDGRLIRTNLSHFPS